VICEFGDVAIVPFPFVDKVVAKVRPALVLSKAEFNDQNGHTMLAMITTAKASAWPTDVAIVDGDAAGLRQPSTLRWKVFTLPNDLIQRRAGALGDRDRRAVKAALRKAMP
jgi:mRNA interferase MazF